MDIKVTIKKPRPTVNRAQVACASGEDQESRPFVSMHIGQFDAHDILSAVAHLKLTPAEALDLADRLRKAAGGQ